MNKPSHHHVNMRKNWRLSHEWLRTASSCHSFVSKMETGGSIEMLINSDQPARCHTPEDSKKSNLKVNTNFSYSGFLSISDWTSARFLLKPIEQSDSCFMTHKKWRRRGYLGILSFCLHSEQWKKKSWCLTPSAQIYEVFFARSLHTLPSESHFISISLLPVRVTEHAKITFLHLISVIIFPDV